jgi:glucose/arabinose dehydrogenase
MRRAPVPIALASLALAVAAACSTPPVTTSSMPTFSTAPGTSGTAAATTTTGAAATTSTTTSGTDGTTVTSTTATTGDTTTTTEPIPAGEINLALEEAAGGLSRPVFLTAPAGDDRLFVVEQTGRIQVLRGGTRLGAFLDLSPLISTGGERGLLGMAFHPAYPADPRFYVNYTDRAGDTVVAEYRVSADPNRADPTSARILLTVDQPFENHNGGMLAFGPDGYLYIGMGDGGGAGDPGGNGQDPASLLGSLLRIGVDGDPYTVPDNGWSEIGGAPEVWAKGLRNPWRFSFDGDLLYLADVGQRDREEIDIAHADSRLLDFGWNVMEGSLCFRAQECAQEGRLLPVLEYPHENGNCSVTGGYVYRGQDVPELAGTYFYGDYCSGMVASFRHDLEGIYALTDWTESLGAVPGLTSFGVDGRGELYLVAHSGTIYRLVRG